MTNPTTPRTADGKIDIRALWQLCDEFGIPRSIKARGRICGICGIEEDIAIYCAARKRQVSRPALHRPVEVRLSFLEARKHLSP